MNLLSLDSNPRHNGIHMIFDSSGGMVVDAINMRSYVEGYPPDIPVTMYNTGGVQSAAVLVFLSAAHRVVSPYAKFLRHPATWKQTAGLNSEQHRIVSRSLAKNDKDIDDILKTRINCRLRNGNRRGVFSLKSLRKKQSTLDLPMRLETGRCQKENRFLRSCPPRNSFAAC
jgi:ATP-dependent protease ClpP protease subunit